MIEEDTIKLLRECDSGIKMGISAIKDILDEVQNKKMKDSLEDNMKAHNRLKEEIQLLLEEYKDEGKNPNPMVKGMSLMKTNLKMAMDKSDNTIADLMTDGCNMGVKSLSRYLNQYQAASKKAKDITKRLIQLEEKLVWDLRDYL